MILMTKFDGSFATSRWLRILKEELVGPVNASTWLKQADVRLEGKPASWTECTPEVVWIFTVNNIAAATVEDKNIFI